MLTLNIWFHGSSELHLHDLLCGIFPRVPGRVSRHYVKLSCKIYINRVLQTHGWEKPGAKESNHFDSVPISADTATALLFVHLKILLSTPT
jgi:hypothetical protein